MLSQKKGCLWMIMNAADIVYQKFYITGQKNGNTICEKVENSIY